MVPLVARAHAWESRAEVRSQTDPGDFADGASRSSLGQRPRLRARWRGWIRVSPGRFALFCALGAVAGLMALIFLVNPGLVANDAVTYLAAGERLNAGHNLYALSPGDRAVPLLPPYWTVPLLSPPFIAVIWRPLALLPPAASVAAWTLAGFVAVLVAVRWSIGRRDALVAVTIAVLSQGIAVVAVTGNVDAFLLLISLLVWRLGRRDHEKAVGALVALSIALKITTVGFAWMLLVERRWRALGAMVVVGAAMAALSLLGAGVPAHLDWLGIARETTATGATPTSIAGIATALGVPSGIASLLPVGFLAVCGVAMVALRDRPAPVFALAVVSGVFGSPVANLTNLARLLGVLAPVATPEPDGLPDVPVAIADDSGAGAPLATPLRPD